MLLLLLSNFTTSLLFIHFCNVNTSFPPVGLALKQSNISMSSAVTEGWTDASLNRRKNAAVTLTSSIIARLIPIHLREPTENGTNAVFILSSSLGLPASSIHRSGTKASGSGNASGSRLDCIVLCAHNSTFRYVYATDGCVAECCPRQRCNDGWIESQRFVETGL